MEDELPAKESHIWTLSDFIERRKDWDQRDEVRLEEYLQQLSNKITQGAKSTLNELNDLVASIDDTAVQIANINNEFQLLADKQFIENKVQEEDETVKKEVEVNKPVARKTNDANTLENNLKEVLKISFKAVNTHFEKVTVVVSDSDADDDDDELKHEETVLRPRPLYKKLNLPSLNGNTQSEITANIVMSSDSDSDVQQPTQTFKDEHSLSSNDAHEEDIHSISESKSIHEPNPHHVDTSSNIFEPEKLKPKNIPTYTDNTEDDLFSPPPLLNYNDEDDLDNEYNMFDNDSNNMYGERNLWNDDDDDNFSNDPPLPIYSEEPPQQVIKSHIQEKVEVPSIQQSLNDELHQRFRKNNISFSSDNVNVESPKVKLPKGAVNILGGTDVKPYVVSSTQNIKQATISQISKSMTKQVENDNVDIVNEDSNNSNKLLNKDNQNPVISTYKNLKTETKLIKKPSLFDQDSDEEDLFVDKTSKTIPILKSGITKEKENLTRSIFSESDSDEEIINSKSTNAKEPVSHFNIDNNAPKLLESSSDDDLFNIKSTNNKTILKQKSTLFSSEVRDEKVNESNKIKNEIKQKSKSSIEDDGVKKILNKEIVEESKVNLKESSIIADDKVTNNEMPNNYILNSKETLSMDHSVIQSNQKSLNSQDTKKFIYLFSSDEDEFDDNTFFNDNESNEKSIKIDRTITNSTELVKNRNDESMYASRVKMFDSSSSDDDMFITNKPNDNFTSAKNNTQSNIIKSIEPQPNVNHAIINQVQKAEHEKINSFGKVSIDKTNTNTSSILSTDIEDGKYLSFKNETSDSSINLFGSQNINETETVKGTSSSSEEFLSPQVDLKNIDIFHNSSEENLFDSKNQESFDEKQPMDISKNEKTLPISDKMTVQNIKSSIFSNSDDEEHLSFNSKFLNESSKNETEVIHSTLNSLSEHTVNVVNQGLLNEKIDTDVPKFNEISDGQKLRFDTDILNESSKIEISPSDSNMSKESLKDSVDGSFFSSPNLENEKPKKLPGKLNKNAGAFINVVGLLPGSKTPLKKSDIHRSASLDENNEKNLPTSGMKLFSAEKDRAKIHVKRRPQSRKARLAAARISFIETGPESNLNESSRLFGSSSNLVDYQSSPILSEDFMDSSNLVQNKNQEPLNNISQLVVTTNDDKTEKNGEIKKKIFDLFDENLDPFELTREKINENDNKENKSDEKLVYCVEQQLKIETVQESHLEIESKNEKTSEIESVSDKLTEIKPICDEEANLVNAIKVEENTSITRNTVLPTKSNSIFDDGDNDLFSSKCEKSKKSSSNIFDSDDEFEFTQKFAKKNSVKSQSLFGDDSDDDLFATPISKLSASNLPSRKPNDKMDDRRQNRSDGYVKLTAESVDVNPLEECKKN